jgi:Ca-activated chloride channel homolog
MVARAGTHERGRRMNEIAASLAAWLAALQDNAFVESMRALFGPAREFHFLRPWWLLGLLSLPLFVLWWRRRRDEQGAWRGAIDAHLLRHLLQTEERAQGARAQRALRVFGRAATLAGVTLAFFALAGPSWRTQPQPLFQDRTPLVIALDLSERILATDLPPSRLQRARAKIADIMRRRGGGQMALVVYADDAFAVTPLTEDSANIVLYLDALHPNVMPESGSRTDRGIAEAALLLRRAGFPRGDILVITDRIDGSTRLTENAASDAAGEGYRVSVLGLGSERGASRVNRDGSTDVIRLDEAALRDLAAAGKGRYAPVVVDDSDLRAIGVLDAQQIDATVAGGKRGTMAIDEGYWLLPLLMLAGLFAFRRGVLVVALLCCLPWHPVQADDRDVQGTLWLRHDQQQHRQMQTASDAYRKRDFQNAERLWASLPGADAAYNQGNALARQGRYPEAVEAYDRALREQPGMNDAIENRRAVLEAMRNKNKPPSQQRQDQKNQQQGRQQGQQKQGDNSRQNGGQQQNDQRQNGGQPKQPQRNAENSKGNQNDAPEASTQRNPQSGGNRPQQAQNQPDQNQPGQNQPGQNQPGQGMQGQGAQSQKSQDPAPKQNSQASAAAKNPGRNQTNSAAGERDNAPEPGNDPKAQRQANAAQRAQMERALAQRKPAAAAATATGGGQSREPLTAQQRQQAILNEARLRRVTDDPGGLLRAKFNAEKHRRRRADDRR